MFNEETNTDSYPMDWIPFLYDLVKCCFLPSLVTSSHPPSLSMTPKCRAAPHTLDCWRINQAKIILYRGLINERIHKWLLLMSFYHVIISSPNYFSRPVSATGWTLISVDTHSSKLKSLMVLKLMYVNLSMLSLLHLRSFWDFYIINEFFPELPKSDL